MQLEHPGLVAVLGPLEADRPQGYADFDKGAAKKFVLDPHGLVSV